MNSKDILFIFTSCNHLEKKLKLLQNERCLSFLLKELLPFRWFFIFTACIKDGLNHLTADSVTVLLYNSAEIVLNGKCKKQYVPICALLLQHLCKESSTSDFHFILDFRIMRALYSLSKEKEIEPVKAFLEAVDKAWLKRQFTRCRHDLKWLIIASFECDLLEYIFCCAFETTEERKEFCSQPIINDVANHFFVVNQPDNIDKILSFPF